MKKYQKKIEKTIDRILYPRHYWHDISFDELGQLYASLWKSFVMWLAVFVSIFSPGMLYGVVFTIAAIGSSAVLLEKFPALNPKKV